jgi:hypothetical protein
MRMCMLAMIYMTRRWTYMAGKRKHTAICRKDRDLVPMPDVCNSNSLCLPAVHAIQGQHTHVLGRFAIPLVT